jgi:pimeloyl-ACP methyl ester carboxylesterase
MDKEIVIAGKKIFYRVHGSGKKLMLVHGFGETGDVWQNQIEFLANRMQLIVPDLPGSGRSDRVEDMSMEGMAEVLNAIAGKEDLNLFTLIGHSMGGYILLAFAEKYASCLSAFGLFHSSAYADTEEKKATRRKGIGFIREHGAFEFLKTSAPNLFSPLSRVENQPLIERFIGELNNFSPESLVSYYEAMMMRPDRTSILKNTQVPVLFIFGEHDTAIPLADGLKQCSLPENSYIHILRKSGHMGMLEEADLSNEILKNFCSTACLF